MPSNDNMDEKKKDVPEMKWYVVHTYSGFENKVKATIEQKIVTMGLEDQITQVLIPTEEVVEMKGGKKQISTKKFYPGYILVKMRMNEINWHFIRNIPKVTGFVGGAQPPPIPESEVKKIVHQMESGHRKPKQKSALNVGDKVRIIDGPFANFNGVVDEVNKEKNKVRVMVSIFGRATPVEFEFLQVEPL